ncbi:hypothetical protein [Streptomyces syringium]|uniref:hypothetical protein n=1 Tax=Streptomyces syringium TaxID=76729 RepID=UPI0037D7D0F2
MPVSIMRNRQCAQCDTYNHPWRPTCMACGLPMPHAIKARTHAAQVLDLTAEGADWIGWLAFTFFSISAASDALFQGTGVDLDDVIPGLAAYGAARVAVLILGAVADCTRGPDTAPDWPDTRAADGDRT